MQSCAHVLTRATPKFALSKPNSIVLLDILAKFLQNFQQLVCVSHFFLDLGKLCSSQAGCQGYETHDPPQGDEASGVGLESSIRRAHSLASTSVSFRDMDQTREAFWPTTHVYCAPNHGHEARFDLSNSSAGSLFPVI